MIDQKVNRKLWYLVILDLSPTWSVIFRDLIWRQFCFLEFSELYLICLLKYSFLSYRKFSQRWNKRYKIVGLVMNYFCKNKQSILKFPLRICDEIITLLFSVYIDLPIIHIALIFILFNYKCYFLKVIIFSCAKNNSGYKLKYRKLIILTSKYGNMKNFTIIILLSRN